MMSRRALGGAENAGTGDAPRACRFPTGHVRASILALLAIALPVAVASEGEIGDSHVAPASPPSLTAPTRTADTTSSGSAGSAIDATSSAPVSSAASATHATSSAAAGSAAGVVVAGTVVGPTRTPVANAEVRLVTDREAGARAVRTGDDGSFRFDGVPAGRYVLIVTEPSTPTTVRRRLRVDIGLAPVSIVLAGAGFLETVTVTPSRSREMLIDTSADARVMDAEAVRSSGAVRLDDVLRQVPGFTLFRRTSSSIANPTTQGASLRGVGGSGAGRVLVLEDGLPLNDPFGGWIAWGRVPRASIERVEIVQGGSNLYGMSALAGVVQVLTRPPSSGGFDVEGSAGNLGTRDASLWTGGSAGAWHGSVGAEVYATDGYVPVVEDARGAADRPAGSSQRAVEIQGQRDFDTSRLFARASLFDESRENGTAFQENSTAWRQLALGWDGSLAQGRSLGGEASVRAYLSREHYEQTFSSVSADRSSETPTREQAVPSKAYGLSAQWRHTTPGGASLLAGAEASHVSGESREEPLGAVGVATRGGGTQTSAAAFGEGESRFGRVLTFDYGLRFDRWTNVGRVSARPGAAGSSQRRSESAWSPRLSLRAAAVRGVSFAASVYRTFRAPTLNELYRSFRVGDVVTLAEDSLEAERLRGAEAGGQIVTPSGTFHGRLRLFRMEVRDPIANVTLDATSSPIVRQRRNLGRTVSRGVSLDLEASPSPRWAVALGYLFTDATVREAPGVPALEGKQVPLVARDQATLQLRYRAGAFAASVQSRWSGPVYDDDLNTLRLASALTLDASTSVTIKKGLDVFAAGENLFDERVEASRTPVLTLGSPRTIRAGLRFRAGGP